MNKNLEFDFSVDRENKTITIKREFNADISLVWDAYTKREILDQWWAPKPWKARSKQMDFREGGQWIYAMLGPEGEEHWAIVKYKAIHFQKQFIGIDAFSDSDGIINKEMPQTNWEVNFTEKGEKTLVVINMSFDDLESLEKIIEMGFKEGMSAAMEGLDELLVALK